MLYGKFAEQVENTFINFVTNHNRIPLMPDLRREGVQYYHIQSSFGDYKGLVAEMEAKHSTLIKKARESEKKNESEKDDARFVLLTKTFSEWCRRNKKIPTEIKKKEFSEFGSSQEEIVRLFGNYADFVAKSKEDHPRDFDGLFDLSEWDQSKQDRVQDEIRDVKVFFISTVVTGAKVSPKCYDAVETFCRHRSAKKMFLIADDDLESIDPKVQNDYLVMNDLDINENLGISGIRIRSTQIDPSTGLHRLVDATGRSIVFASPKQRLETKARNKTVSVPNVVMGTGAITEPNYRGKMFRNDRLSKIAETEHVMGGIIIEVVDDKHFHYRQVQFNLKFEMVKSNMIQMGDCSFHDLGYRYFPNGKITKESPKAIVYGDIHEADVDQEVLDHTAALVEKLEIKTCVLHDIFDGKSINPHEKDKKIIKARKYQQGDLDLVKELDGVVDRLVYFSRMFDRIVIPKSNHDVFLDRWLEDFYFREDDQNRIIAMELSGIKSDGLDPLKTYTMRKVEKILKIEKIKSPEFVWLEEGQSYTIEGVEVGAHGHRGPNGTKGSTISLSKNLGSSFIGHFHRPEIRARLFAVGTSSILVPDYTRGNPVSNWMHTHGLVYRGGGQTLVNLIHGRFTEFFKKPEDTAKKRKSRRKK